MGTEDLCAPNPLRQGWVNQTPSLSYFLAVTPALLFPKNNHAVASLARSANMGAVKNAL